MGEEWPDEPEEPDPEERYGSPERDLPPVPATPEPPATAPESDVDTDTDTDVDSELLSAWWYSVVLANVAFGGVTVGLVLVGFRRMWLVGGAAVALGVLAGLRLRTVIRTYRAGTADDGDGDGDGDRDEADPTEPVEPPRHD